MEAKLRGAQAQDESDSERQPLVSRDDDPKMSATAVYVIGGLLTGIAIMALSVQQEVMQSAESKGNVDKPSLTIWWNHTCLMVGLPLGLILQIWRERSASPLLLWRRLLERQRWGAWRALCLLVVLAVAFFLPNLAWAITLKSVWVPLVTAASRFDSVFVLMFGSLFTCKAPPLKQALSVMACIVGVILISFGQEKDPSSGKAGGTGSWEYAEVFISPCLAALYSMIFNWLAKDVADDPACMCTLLGLIGLVNAVLLWPVVPVCEAAGLEHQRLSSIFTGDALRSIILNAALATIGNFSQMPAVALTSPLFVSLGMLLLMPVTVLIDWLVMHHTKLNAALVCGSLGICVGSGYSIITEAFEQAAAPAEAVAPASPGKLAAATKLPRDQKAV